MSHITVAPSSLVPPPNHDLQTEVLPPVRPAGQPLTEGFDRAAFESRPGLRPLFEIEARAIDPSLGAESPLPIHLGEVRPREVSSAVKEIAVLPDLEISYPPVVIQALRNIVREYNGAFRGIVDANRENRLDYRALMDDKGAPYNLAVQIDMCGLSPSFLRTAMFATEAEVRLVLKQSIFEIENSIAAYDIISKMYGRSRSGRGRLESAAMEGFKRRIDQVRQKSGMPVALLACTQEKYDGMLAFEFRRLAGSELDPAYVKSVTGFDAFFSPEQFRAHVKEFGTSKYLLYVRNSEPIAKLRKPSIASPESILSDPVIRQIVRMHSLTFNIDIPELPIGDERRINDTKAYLPEMEMGKRIDRASDLRSESLKSFVVRSGGRADSLLRLKPMQSSYGCYGHIRGKAGDDSFCAALQKAIAQRGPYIAQVERDTPRYLDTATQLTFNYIDRAFLGASGDEVTYFGGVRTLSPSDGEEVKHGRIHGSATSLYAPIE